MKVFRILVAAAVTLTAWHGASAQALHSQKPLLIIGASYAEAKTPFSNGVAPLGGVAVALGSYLSLGNALVRNNKLPGYVINEAQAGATSFARLACAPGAATCGPAGWDSYQTQLERAIARVAVPPALTTLNAKYVLIIKPNDCMHSDAFGIPQSQAQPCTLADMNASVDRMLAAGQYAVSRGLTPIYDIMPPYEGLDLPLFHARYGLQWVISESDYNALRTLHMTRLQNELPEAIVLDIWKDFVHVGDGLHPNAETNTRAANRIAKTLLKLDE